VVLGHVVGQAPTSIKDHGVIDNEKKKKTDLMWSQHRQLAMVRHTRLDNKPRDVVSPPTVGGGTTSRGLTINLVMWFPHRLSVGKPHHEVSGGTTSRGLLINLVMWFPHRQSVGKPHHEV
jgi:hypothetical protein